MSIREDYKFRESELEKYKSKDFKSLQSTDFRGLLNKVQSKGSEVEGSDRRVRARKLRVRQGE